MVIFCFSVPLSVLATELLDTKIQHLESNIDVKIIEENLSLKKNRNGEFTDLLIKKVLCNLLK